MPKCAEPVVPNRTARAVARFLQTQLLAVITTVVASSVSISASSARADDLADIRATVELEGKLFASRDVSVAARVFAPDVIWQNPFGVRLHSEAQLERFLTGLFRQPGYEAGKLTSTPSFTDVTRLSATSATAWEQDASDGQIDDSTGKPIALRNSHVLYVLEKRHGKWLIIDEMIMDEHVR